MIVILATCASFLAMFIAMGLSNWETVKANWNEYRCDPRYMAFSSYADPKTSASENFTFCLNQAAGSVWGVVIDQFNSYFGVVNNSVSDMVGPLNGFRSVMSNIRNFMLEYTKQALSKITQTTSSFSFIIIKIRDILERFVAEGYIAAFLAQTAVDFIWSFVMLCINIIKGFVYALLAISIILALFQPALLILAILIAALIGASGF